MRALPLLLAVVFSVATPLATPVRAQGVQHGVIDAAVVRVLALGAADLHELSYEGIPMQVAVPASGHGSGFIVDAKGLIVTAAHVVKGARHLAVMLPGSDRAYPAKLVLANDRQDYAFVRMAGEFGSVAQLAAPEDRLSVRQNVFTVGYPMDATRFDPQSTPGVVSSSMPDGMLQLAMSANAGNSGGPVIDDQERVHGVLVARSKVERGYAGMAWAVPTHMFARDLKTILAGAHQLQDDALLRAPEQQQLSDLAALLAYEGAELVLASLVDARADDRALEKRVVSLAEQLTRSAEAQLLAACYFWNRHVRERMRHSPDEAVMRARAKQYAASAVKIDASLQHDSAFVKLALGVPSGAMTSASSTAGSRAAAQPGELVPVHFERVRGSDAVSLFVVEKRSPLQVRTAWGRGIYAARLALERCKAPCDTQLEAGTLEVAVGSPGSARSAGRTYLQLTAPSTLRAYYTSRRAVRSAGLAVLVIGGAAGLGLMIAGAVVPNCGPDEVKPLCPNGAMLAGGGVTLGASVVVGSIMLSIKDRAQLTISPTISRDAAGMVLRARL